MRVGLGLEDLCFAAVPSGTEKCSVNISLGKSGKQETGGLSPLPHLTLPLSLTSVSSRGRNGPRRGKREPLVREQEEINELCHPSPRLHKSRTVPVPPWEEQPSFMSLSAGGYAGISSFAPLPPAGEGARRSWWCLKAWLS